MTPATLTLIIFQQYTHNFLMNRIQAFSMRRQCNLKISLEKNLKTCKEKFQYEMRREKKKNTKWLLSESLLYQSGDPVAVKMPETVTPEGRKIDRAGPSPFLPEEIKFRILSEKLKENGEDRRRRGRCSPPEKQL